MFGERRWRLLFVLFLISMAMIVTWLVMALLQFYTLSMWVIANRWWWKNLLGIGLVINVFIFFINLRMRRTSRRARRKQEG